LDTVTAQKPDRHATWLGWPRPSWTWLLILGLLSRIAVVAWGDACAGHGPPESLLKNDQTVAAPNRNYNARHMTALAVGGRRFVEPWTWLAASILAEAKLIELFVNWEFIG
jgi:hypothetical protein